MTARERMLAGMLYRTGDDAEVAAEFNECRRLTQLYNATTVDQLEYRTELLKQLLGSTGERIFIEPTFRCDFGRRIHVGENFYANFDCIILDVCEVRTGRNCMLGPRVNIYTATHPTDPEVRADGLEFGRPVTIGDDVWVGGGAIIGPGVTIGSGVIIGAGAVVTKDIPDRVIAFGNPCRVHRAISDQDKRYWQAQQAIYYAEH